MNTIVPPASPGPDARPVDVAFVRQEARLHYRQSLTPATRDSVGLDLCACLETEEALIPAGARLRVPTGISVQPRVPGVAGFVYSRSGLGACEGLVVAQGVGVIDPDYTGEIFVFLLNTSGEERRIKNGDRIAQLVFQPCVRPLWREVAALAPTDRGSGGFGHTGR